VGGIWRFADVRWPKPHENADAMTKMSSPLLSLGQHINSMSGTIGLWKGDYLPSQQLVLPFPA
jgi:hypothetical protein